MASIIPPEYVYWHGYGYVKISDLSGPYAIDSAGVATLIGSGGGGGGTTDIWTQGGIAIDTQGGVAIATQG